jgi:hypothetical protein
MKLFFKTKRNLYDLTEEEIKKINEILKDEYQYDYTFPLKNSNIIEYQLFKKSRACFSGIGVIKVYKYLKSIGIDINEI